MHPATWILTLLMTLGLMIAVAFPLWFAWIVAWRSGMTRSLRRSFAMVCGLLTYGVVLMVDALFLPFDMFATFAAPSLINAGHDATANVIVLVSREVGSCADPANTDQRSGTVGVAMRWNGAPTRSARWEGLRAASSSLVRCTGDPPFNGGVRACRRCVGPSHDFPRIPETSPRANPCRGGCRTPRPSRTSAA